MRVRNIRTGIESDYPARQAQWLIQTGRCEAVKPVKSRDTGVKATKRATYQTKDMQADVAVPQATEKPE